MLGQHRSTQRRIPRGRDDEDRLVADMIELARQYGRYGYRRIAALLRDAGWQVNDKRVERLWRREGLKVPGKQPKRGHLWLNDGSCIRLRAERADHVWSYDFVHHRTYDGRAFRMLNVLDEFTRKSLAIRVRRKLSSTDVIDVLTDLFILRGISNSVGQHLTLFFVTSHSRHGPPSRYALGSGIGMKEVVAWSSTAPSSPRKMQSLRFSAARPRRPGCRGRSVP